MLHGHNRYGYWQDVIDTRHPAGGGGGLILRGSYGKRKEPNMMKVFESVMKKIWFDKQLSGMNRTL